MLLKLPSFFKYKIFLVPPTLWITHQLIGADLGGTAQLECLTAAHPPSINYWSRDGKNYLPHHE